MFLSCFADDCYEILRSENKLSYRKQLGPLCILEMQLIDIQDGAVYLTERYSFFI